MRFSVGAVMFPCVSPLNKFWCRNLNAKNPGPYVAPYVKQHTNREPYREPYTERTSTVSGSLSVGDFVFESAKLSEAFEKLNSGVCPPNRFMCIYIIRRYGVSASFFFLLGRLGDLQCPRRRSCHHTYEIFLGVVTSSV